MRGFTIEVDAPCVNLAQRLHRYGIYNLYRRLIFMILREGVSSSVADIESPVIEFDGFGFPSHLTRGHHLLCPDVYLGHIAFFEGLVATHVGIAGDVEICSVRTHAAVVGHVFCGATCSAIRVDVLDDVRPVDSNGYQRVVHLDDVIGSVAQFRAVDGAEPLVGQYSRCRVVVGQLSVVRLPVALVADNQVFTSEYRVGDRWVFPKIIVRTTGCKEHHRP